MRTSTAYQAAVRHLASDAATGALASFEIENAAAGIAAQYGVSDSDVRDDVAAASTLPQADSDTFFCVCIEGTQIGAACNSVEDANQAITAHLDDGVDLSLLTVEAYRQGANDEFPVAATPFFKDGRWHAAVQAAAS